ncbi:hypothetical protein K474DRAFT_1563261, partial [Panus rudis PR-1116 ss-1]
FVQMDILMQIHKLHFAKNTDPCFILDKLQSFDKKYTTAGGDISDAQYHSHILGCLLISYQ